MQRKCQAVPHMQRARHIRWRHHNRIGFRCTAGVTLKMTAGFPRLAPARLSSLAIKGFFHGHGERFPIRVKCFVEWEIN